jgi:hypothetical protein
MLDLAPRTDQDRTVIARRSKNDHRRANNHVNKGEVPNRLYSPGIRYYEHGAIPAERLRERHELELRIDREGEESDREYKAGERADALEGDRATAQYQEDLERKSIITRGKSPTDKHDRLARNSDHAVVERAGTLRLRRSSIPLYSHSITPSGRSISIATFLNGQCPLEYYDKEELRGSLMDRYPVQFDKQPYDPQLSQ